MKPLAANRLPAPASWHVWKKSNPRVFAEVTESSWDSAIIKGACKISAATREAVMFDDLEAVPSDSNMVHLEVERMRRAMLRNPPVVHRRR